MIAVSEFVKRQTPESEFSYFDGTWEELRHRTQRNFDAGHIIPGYRDGVILVKVEPGVPEHPGCFYTNIVELQEGDVLAGEYKARQEGEEPRKSTWVVGGKKLPAEAVQIVLYRHDVLAENNEQSCDDEWEIISINASPFEANEEVPMSPGTMMANHFHLSGGTETGWDNDRFVLELKKSVLFWKNKSKAKGSTVPQTSLKHPFPWKTACYDYCEIPGSGFVSFPFKVDVVDANGELVANCHSEEMAQFIVDRTK